MAGGGEGKVEAAIAVLVAGADRVGGGAGAAGRAASSSAAPIKPMLCAVRRQAGYPLQASEYRGRR